MPTIPDGVTALFSQEGDTITLELYYRSSAQKAALLKRLRLHTQTHSDNPPFTITIETESGEHGTIVVKPITEANEKIFEALLQSLELEWAGPLQTPEKDDIIS
jgi:hypothetical protein